MSLSPSNIDKIIKLLRMTLSDNDNESLSAIRKANIILNKNKVKDWKDVFDSLTIVKTNTVYVEVEKNRKTDSWLNKDDESLSIDHDYIMQMFTYIVKETKHRSKFFMSILEQYNERRTLTEKQIDALERIYESL